MYKAMWKYTPLLERKLVSVQIKENDWLNVTFEIDSDFYFMLHRISLLRDNLAIIPCPFTMGLCPPLSGRVKHAFMVPSFSSKDVVVIFNVGVPIGFAALEALYTLSNDPFPSFVGKAHTMSLLFILCSGSFGPENPIAMKRCESCFSAEKQQSMFAPVISHSNVN